MKKIIAQCLLCGKAFVTSQEALDAQDVEDASSIESEVMVDVEQHIFTEHFCSMEYEELNKLFKPFWAWVEPKKLLPLKKREYPEGPQE